MQTFGGDDFLLLFCTDLFFLQFKLDIFIVHPPPELLSNRTNLPKAVLVCCAFGLRTWDFVIVVVAAAVVIRIYLFSAYGFSHMLLLLTLYE